MELQKKKLEKVKNTLDIIQKKGTKADYNLLIYSQVINLVDYNFRLMETLMNFDKAKTIEEEVHHLETIYDINNEFTLIRKEFEEVYSQTRILNKPEDYILDQDHHRHTANQSINFDWQFTSEIMLLKKIQDAESLLHTYCPFHLLPKNNIHFPKKHVVLLLPP